MCGIAGIFSLTGLPVAPEELVAMCSTLAHRGPDDEGYYLEKGVGLGMRRLSIIDLETGRQPVHNEDGSVHVVFNGEIYNYRHLRDVLRRLGHRFHTATDTETIVHLYEEYGPRCVESLRGMFAFALWDQRRRTLLLARDRLGIKPLYFATIGDRLLFASELKAILQLPGVERQLNWTSVGYLFTFLTTPPTESILNGIRKLEPGHVLIASSEKGVRVRRYWDIRFTPDYSRSPTDWVEGLRETLAESVSLHLASDVPIGAFLSGGVDSTSIVGEMARLSTNPIKTFSIGFPDEDFNELGYARLAAERFGTAHHERILAPDALTFIEDLAWFLDEPSGDSSVIPTYLLALSASEHVKVVLSGDGGDELFAGYERYLVEQRERRLGFLPAVVRRGLGCLSRLWPQRVRGRNLLYHFSLSGPERYLDALTLFRISDQQDLFQAEAYEQIRPVDPYAGPLESLAEGNGDWLSTLQRLDVRYSLPLDILTKVDRMSMAHSLEVRVPLLDHKLVEFAATIPPELKLRASTTKYIFKRAVEGLVPEPIIHRRKQGFAVPLGRWFRGHLEPFVRDLLLSETALQRRIFNPQSIERLLALPERGRALDLQLWTLVSFELWCRTFLDRRPTLASSENLAGVGAQWRKSQP